MNRSQLDVTAALPGQMLALAVADPPSSPLPDADPVLARLDAGDARGAIAAAARAHGALLGRVCMAMLGSRADADEAVQETLLQAHRSLPGFRREASVRAWLCGIARHVCARRLETRSRQARVLEVVPQAGAADEAYQLGQRARVVRRALGQLRPSDREPLILRFVADLDYREVAAVLDVDEPAARKRVSRALAALRQIFPTEELS